MKLGAYLKARDLTDSAFARLLGVSPATIQRIQISGTHSRTASLALALRIEQATGGEVAADELPLSKASRRALRGIRNGSPTPASVEDAEEQGATNRGAA